MATMMSGASVMDAAVLLIAANERVPQPQTEEHLAGASIMGLEHVVTVQNKVDLVGFDGARENHEQILEFIKGTAAERAPVIPVCCSPANIASHKSFNLDVLCQYLTERVPEPKRELSKPFLMPIIRSFDVNRPGTLFEELKGGVAGGSILQGILKVGDKIEVRPGLVLKAADGRLSYRPIQTKVISLHSEQTPLQFATPGGLIGVGTLIDPTITKSDRLAGQIAGVPGNMPEVYQALELKFILLRRTVDASHKKATITVGNQLLCTVWSLSVPGTVTYAKAGVLRLELKGPACVPAGARVSLSQRHDKGGWRLVGVGMLTRGLPAAAATC
eukprot:TRINITY_DN6571_c0_g1_i3.p1 TRINITY_DN6571_c0_g1~~TRINITY_DN6571_c0_g1_i3.p1  ORF type:complete len:331 (-),score=65.46 TRINITY_DN6571_c0_g1_i3:117-1109(-)